MTDAREVLAEIQQRADNDYWDNTTSARLAFDDREALVAALTAVLDLHKPYEHSCMGCIDQHRPGTRCVACKVDWPCRTYEAVAGALGGGS